MNNRVHSECSDTSPRANGGNSIPMRRKREATHRERTSGDGPATEDRAVSSDVGENSVVTIRHQANVKMKQQVGLVGGVAFIVGTMIGSGIFISPKSVLSGTGSVAASLLVWTGCGVIALCGALCFAELGTMIHKSGGEFSYLKESLGPVPAFISVWTGIIMSKTSSQAIIALSFAQYVLTPVFDACGPPQLLLKLVAATVICKCCTCHLNWWPQSLLNWRFFLSSSYWVIAVTVAIVNCYSAKLAARVQVVFMLIKVIALIVIIVGGIVKLAQGNTGYIATGFEDSETNPSVIALAFYGGLWAFDGWNSLNYLTEELVNPNVNLPRAIWIALPLVMVIYLLTNISYLTVLSKDILLASPAVAVSWGDRVLGSVSTVIPLAVACSTFGALNGSCFTGGRLFYVAARAGHFPSILSYVHVHQLTPWCSLIFTTVISLILILPGNISRLINFFSFTAWMINGATFLGLIVMRFTRKDWARPYKVPVVIPAVLVLISGYLVVAPIVQDPQIEFLYAALIIFCGLILYVPFVHFKLKLGCMDSLITRAQLFLQVAPSKFEP
ncbi:b(0,+)-type amino acid transporter 1-like [Liolophura sinensis]|uniref:b(0,+)-type amino acid transporter 1-like n=1 Tax=Liolophura sinensis TaxID=3198878 RepID=UPI00315806DD